MVPSIIAWRHCFSIWQKISNSSDIDAVVEELAQKDLEADLVLLRENSSYTAVMITNVEICHAPTLVKKSRGQVHRSIKKTVVLISQHTNPGIRLLSHIYMTDKVTCIKTVFVFFRVMAMYELQVTQVTDIDFEPCEEKIQELFYQFLE